MRAPVDLIPCPQQNQIAQAASPPARSSHHVRPVQSPAREITVHTDGPEYAASWIPDARDAPLASTCIGCFASRNRNWNGG